LVSAGIPTALHVNARTDHDWDRWTDFIAKRPEVTAIAFEFATGARYEGRAALYVEQLCRLRRAVNRNLHLVIRGGRFLDRLKETFAKVTLIDTAIYFKSHGRQKLVAVNGSKRRWERTMTLFDEPIDRVMAQNVS